MEINDAIMMFPYQILKGLASAILEAKAWTDLMVARPVGRPNKRYHCIRDGLVIRSDWTAMG
jgi:hypothetical protein